MVGRAANISAGQGHGRLALKACKTIVRDARQNVKVFLVWVGDLEKKDTTVQIVL